LKNDEDINTSDKLFHHVSPGATLTFFSTSKHTTDSRNERNTKKKKRKKKRRTPPSGRCSPLEERLSGSGGLGCLLLGKPSARHSAGLRRRSVVSPQHQHHLSLQLLHHLLHLLHLLLPPAPPAPPASSRPRVPPPL